MQTFEIFPIGHIETEFNQKEGVPIQPIHGMNSEGIAIVDEKFVKGLKDLDGFSHCYLIFLLDQHSDYQLETRPYLDDETHGVFATRSPKRPNRLGISVVKISKIVENKIYFLGVDILNGSPLLDIKPYIKEFDHIGETKDGWYEKVTPDRSRLSDDRFSK